jgi:tRNA(adenine34) deaminase
MNLSPFDKDCLNLSISQAQESFDQGNFPVGAVLAVDNQVIARGGNSGETSGNYSNHAEAFIIMKNGDLLLKAFKDRHFITLYSTLEPCLMCLGAAVMNKVNRIIYVEPDPLAGACNVDRKSFEVRYRENWPEIVQAGFSSVPLTLVKQFLTNQISKNIRSEWSQRYLDLLP